MFHNEGTWRSTGIRHPLLIHWQKLKKCGCIHTVHVLMHELAFYLHLALKRCCQRPGLADWIAQCRVCSRQEKDKGEGEQGPGCHPCQLPAALALVRCNVKADPNLASMLAAASQHAAASLAAAAGRWHKEGDVLSRTLGVCKCCLSSECPRTALQGRADLPAGRWALSLLAKGCSGADGAHHPSRDCALWGRCDAPWAARFPYRRCLPPASAGRRAGDGARGGARAWHGQHMDRTGASRASQAAGGAPQGGQPVPLPAKG